MFSIVTLVFCIVVLADRNRLLLPTLGANGVPFFDALMYLSFAAAVGSDNLPLAVVAVVMAAANIRRCVEIVRGKKVEHDA